MKFIFKHDNRNKTLNEAILENEELFDVADDFTITPENPLNSKEIINSESSNLSASASIIDLISTTLNQVQQISATIENLSAEEKEEALPILKDLLMTEQENVGKLQSALSLYQDINAIESGKEDAEDILADSESPKEESLTEAKNPNCFTVMFFHDDDTYTGVIDAHSLVEAEDKFKLYCPSCTIDRIKPGRLGFEYPIITSSFEYDMGWKEHEEIPESEEELLDINNVPDIENSDQVLEDDFTLPNDEEPLQEDTIKRDGKWINKGSEGTHGKFDTKKEADAQRKAMFANGYKESLEEDDDEMHMDKVIEANKMFEHLFDNCINNKEESKEALALNEAISKLFSED